MKIVLATYTKFRSPIEYSFDLCIRLFEDAMKEGLEVVMVDDSGQHDDGRKLRDKFREMGIHVFISEKSRVNEAVDYALGLREAPDLIIICEPTALDIVRSFKYASVVFEREKADVIVFERMESSWNTFPLNYVERAKKTNEICSVCAGFPKVHDFLFGVVGLSKRAASLYASYYPPTCWQDPFDQIIFAFQAYKSNLRVRTISVDYLNMIIKKDDFCRSQEKNFFAMMEKAVQSLS